MEKLSFYEIIALVKSNFVDFDSLLTSDNQGNLVNRFGVVIDESSSDERIKCSDDEYFKLSVLIKLLKELMTLRPLPF